MCTEWKDIVLFLWVANAAAARRDMEVRGDHVAVAQIYGRTMRIHTGQVFIDWCHGLRRSDPGMWLTMTYNAGILVAKQAPWEQVKQ